MKNPTIGLKLITDFQVYRNGHRLVKLCWKKADRVIECGTDKDTFSSIFEFEDGSCIELSTIENRVRYFRSMGDALND